MKKTALLLPLALLLVLAAGTSGPAASVTSRQSLEVSSLAGAPMAVMLQDEAQERATLGLEEVSSSVFCNYCPAFLEDCQDENFPGQSCSLSSFGCSCGYCEGQFDCLAP